MSVETSLRGELCGHCIQVYETSKGRTEKVPLRLISNTILRSWLHCGTDRLKQGSVALISWLPLPHSIKTEPIHAAPSRSIFAARGLHGGCRRNFGRLVTCPLPCRLQGAGSGKAFRL